MTKKLKECITSLSNINQMKMIPKECKSLISTELICMDFEVQSIDEKINEFYKRYINNINFLVKLKERIYDMLNQTLVGEDDEIRKMFFELIDRINRQIRLKEKKHEKL